MKKIMFNDKYCLTGMVLEGSKTQTRRIMKGTPFFFNLLNSGNVTAKVKENTKRVVALYNEADCEISDYVCRYGIDEVIAVAQNYEEAGMYQCAMRTTPGWTNKMFVSADLMPHQIKITNIRIERLQDIPDEDCLAEGIESEIFALIPVATTTHYRYPNAGEWFASPREAYASLIDKFSGKGTWESNPWVVVYDFELVK